MKYENHRVHWNPGMTLDNLERVVILSAYEFYKNNKTQTAISLGICVRTLDNKLQRYIADDEERAQRADERKRESEEFLRRCRYGANANVSVNPHVEPAEETTAEYEMPVLERQKVQDVLHDQVTNLGNKRSRGSLSRANG